MHFMGLGNCINSLTHKYSKLGVYASVLRLALGVSLFSVSNFNGQTAICSVDCEIDPGELWLAATFLGM